MPYTITGDETTGYVLTHISGTIKYSLCPCCDKPIATRRIAEILAANLELMEEAELATKQ